PRRGEGVEPKTSVLARERSLPVGEGVVSLVLLAPRLQNLAGGTDNSGAVEGNVQEHDVYLLFFDLPLFATLFGCPPCATWRRRVVAGLGAATLHRSPLRQTGQRPVWYGGNVG